MRPVSPVFHGRDIFAPVAAKVAGGLPLKELGSLMAIGAAAPAPWSEPIFHARYVCARVVLADRFGNLVTSLRAEALRGRSFLEARCGRRRFPFATHYGAVGKGKPLVLVGSHGRLELAVREGSAAVTYAIPAGAEVKVMLSSDPS